MLSNKNKSGTNRHFDWKQYLYGTEKNITFATSINMSKNKLYIILFACLSFVSCGEYQKLLKSSDPDLKYTKAIEYFERKDYMRAQSLLDEVAQYYKGTERSEDVLHYLAECYVGQKDYYSASEYYNAYCKNYPKGRYAENAYYMAAYCHYLNSDDARLDQTETYSAIDAFNLFLERFPESEQSGEAYRLLDEMNDKLAYKEVLNARLYYNLGTYRGNNYESAIIVANNALKDYPLTKHREELSFIVLESMYKQASLSVKERQEERYREALDEYYSFINEFPNGKFRKNADRIFKETDKAIKTLKSLPVPVTLPQE